MKKELIAIALLCCSFMAMAEVLTENKDAYLTFQTLIHNGIQRTYSIHYPNNLKSNSRRPIVFVLHGGGGADAETMAKRTNFNNIADREDIIVVYPVGIDGQWNDGRGKTFRKAKDNSKIDDVGFISSLIDFLIKNGSADPKHIYVYGASNGGMMAYRLGIEIGNKIAAIASVIANLPVSIAKEKPVTSLSVLIMNGTDDPLVPWDGGQVTVFSKKYGEVLSTEDTVNYWVKNNNIFTTSEKLLLADANPEDGCRVIVDNYRMKGDDVEVVLYTIKGGGHNLPGGKGPDRPLIVGKKCKDIDASEIIWKFFKKHSR